MRRPPSVNENSLLTPLCLKPDPSSPLGTDQREVAYVPSCPLVFLHRKVFKHSSLIALRPGFATAPACSGCARPAPPLAPLPSALSWSRIRPGAYWGPSFPFRCCYLCDGLEGQDAERSHPNAAVCGCRYSRPNLQRIILPSSCSDGACSAATFLSPSLCRRGWFRPMAVAQRFVHLSGRPQPVQQHRQLPRHRYDRPLLGILPTSRR